MGVPKSVFVVCYSNGLPEGGLPCAAFSSYGKAIKECRRLAQANMTQKIGYWREFQGADRKGLPIDIFLKETGKGVAVCRRFLGKHYLTFEVEDDICLSENVLSGQAEPARMALMRVI